MIPLLGFAMRLTIAIAIAAVIVIGYGHLAGAMQAFNAVGAG